MKKRFWLSFVLICISVFAAGVINVSAENGIRYEYSDLYYRESNGEVTITDCSQFATTVSIPNQINGYPVTGIGDSAFSGCSKLSSITIPDSVASIGDYAFYNCSSLSSITIPGSVTSIGCDAFLGCTYLANINVSEDNKYYCSINGVLYNKDKTLLVRYAPGKTESSFSVYYSVKSIEDGAFSGCSNLSSITIPNGVTSIGDSAFYYCSNLWSITMIDKATQYTAVILPENATDKELEWGVDDAEIATVSTDGVLTPIKSGTVKITATAKDGSGIYGEKTVNVKVYAEILSLESNVGVFDKMFSPSEREYTIYVPKNTASVKLTARHNGTLKMGTKSLYNGRAATVMLSDDETILKLNYKCEGYSDSIYSVKVVKFEGTKTDVSADGKTFNVKTINVDKDSVVILALYDGNKLIETQSKAYNTELTFTTDKAYVNAKVMVWKSIDGMEPVADVEIIK